MKQFIVRNNNSELDQAVLYSGMQLSKEDIEHVVWSSYLLLYWDSSYHTTLSSRHNKINVYYTS